MVFWKTSSARALLKPASYNGEEKRERGKGNREQGKA